MSNFFHINTLQSSLYTQGYSNAGFSSNKCDKNIFLFMIGGSGASVLEPIIYFFKKQIEESNYKLVPIFIDRNFHSEIVSRSIRNIKKHQIYNTYSCESSGNFITNPFFFVDNGNLLNSKNNLNKLIDSIQDDDIIAFSYSIYNKENLSAKRSIAEHIRVKTNAKIFNMVFLPYFTLNFDDDNFLKNREKSIEINLQMSNPSLTREYSFYAGLPNKGNYKECVYQRNPFNIVSLVLAFALVSSLSEEIEETNASYNYSFPSKDKYNLGDLGMGTLLRQTIISLDFRDICWKLICQERDNLELVNKIDSHTLNIITSYFNDAHSMLRQLSDITINKEFHLYIRKQKDYDFDKIWKYFKNQILYLKIPYTRKTFSRALLKNTDYSLTTTSDMIAYEILHSINEFIKDNYIKIDKMYY